MADTKISALAAGAAVAATDVFPAVETAGVGPVAKTGAQIRTWAQTGISVLRSYLAGYTLSNDGGTPLTVLDIAAGQATDSTNVSYITLGAWTKSVAGAWVAGTGANGMGTGLTIANNTWYHVFAIINGGLADAYFDTSVTAANAPAGTTVFRRIGSFKTDGAAHIVPFKQVEDTFYWLTVVTDVSIASTATADALYTLTVPTGVRVRPYMNAGTTAGFFRISSPDEADVAPGNTNISIAPGFDLNGSFNQVATLTTIYTNTAAQIRAFADTVNTRPLYIYTRGWIDLRGRLA